MFANGAKGHSALQLSRDLDVQYRTAFVMQHKLREAMAAETKDVTLSGTVEIDGAYFGGHVKPANYKEDRIDRRLAENQTGKRKCVVVMRQRGGRTIAVAGKSELEAVPAIMQRVKPGTVIHADEATSWDGLQAHYEMRRINHSVCYSDGEACTNQAESYFSRLRRAELGTHHSIRKRYLSPTPRKWHGARTTAGKQTVRSTCRLRRWRQSILFHVSGRAIGSVIFRSKPPNTHAAPPL